MVSEQLQVRNELLLYLTILLAIALLAGGCARRLGNGQESTDSSAAEMPVSEASIPEVPAAEMQASGTSVQESSAPTDGKPEEEQTTITLREEQIHMGDLILVSASHEYHFAENETEIDLVRILDAQTISYAVGKSEFQLAARVMPHLDAMIADCDRAMGTRYTGISSAYRSKEYQAGVWEEIEALYGESYAESHVAVPGFSEHHTGLAVDLGIFYPSGLEGSFSESDNAQWMKEHCGDYGFIRRYAENKTEITGIKNEAWHFRYVGLPHSAYIMENDLCLEEYLELLREKTDSENPLVIEAGGNEYAVYYTEGTEIPCPAGEYTISGDNMNGYIVTVAQHTIG